MRNSLPREEKIKIMDDLIHKGSVGLDLSKKAEEFYSYWFKVEDVSDEDNRAINFDIRKKPDYPDFAWAFFKKLCARHEVNIFEFIGFSPEDYTTKNGEEVKIYRERMMEEDLKLLKEKILEANGDQCIKERSPSFGYYYKNGLGLGLTKIERKDLQNIFDEIDKIIAEASKLKEPAIAKYINRIKEIRKTIDIIDVDDFISYEKENANKSRFFNDLFLGISERKSFKISRTSNLSELIKEEMFPLFLKQSNNRWYLLYLPVMMLDDASIFFTAKQMENIYDLIQWCPLDQINYLENSDRILPSKFVGIGKPFFKYVYGSMRPRQETGKKPEEVIFRVQKDKEETAFLIRRFKYQKMFPELEMDSETKEHIYYKAKFFITTDVVNRIMSYLPTLQVVSGKELIETLEVRIKNINLGKK
ncbi:hypothetical protein OAF16_01075 [Flavobacteriales bacterium]|nr:hypothetical protein [Flavobacteriales bacterium]